MKMLIPLLAGAALAVTGVGSPLIIGVVDTIGGTTYEWQTNGPARRMLVHAPGAGIHAAWVYSASDETTFPDRNMRYNFLDFATGQWNWIDPDHMVSGVNSYTERCGYGNVDYDPATGVAVISCHLGNPLYPAAARDMAPGAGLFEYCCGSPTVDGYLWPYIGVDANSAVHCAVLDAATRGRLHYSRVQPWCHWDSAFHIPPPQPDPEFDCHNIAASKVSQRVVVTWTYVEGDPDPGFYRESTDGGVTWGVSTELPWPDAYGGDTLEGYQFGLFPHWDRADRLHIVAGVVPYVNGEPRQVPATLWHWCRDNDPQWSQVHRAGCGETVIEPHRMNGWFAQRPSIGEDSRGGLYVAWAQHDSMNYEPETDVLRADIFYARDNYDNGATWQAGVRITDIDSSTDRFPCVIDHFPDDSLRILYLIDSIAGDVMPGWTWYNCPVVVHKVPVYVGIEEPGPAARGRDAGAPTVVRRVLHWRGRASADLLDMSGRIALRIRPGENSLADLSPGVYFVRRAGQGRTSKIVVQR